jgi:hypothetical protein
MKSRLSAGPIICWTNWRTGSRERLSKLKSVNCCKATGSLENSAVRLGNESEVASSRCALAAWSGWTVASGVVALFPW